MVHCFQLILEWKAAVAVLFGNGRTNSDIADVGSLASLVVPGESFLERVFFLQMG